MPIIIDTNCFANVFSKKSAKHQEFKPVLDWILQGKGLIAYGGSTYMKELKKAGKYLTILRLFKEQKKVIVGDSETIDELEKKNKEIFPEDDFDDPHLPAIAMVTNCMLICSEDCRSIKYVKNRKLYPTGVDIPAYYTSKVNHDLLCDKYVHSCNKPLMKITKEKQKAMTTKMEKAITNKKK